jgi:hypothetical protein
MLRLNNIEHRGVNLVDWFCWKKQDCGLQEIREWVGDQAFLRFVSAYSGMYLKLPPSKELSRLAMDLELAQAMDQWRTARKTKNLQELVLAEAKIYKIAQSLNRPLKWARHRGADLLRDIEKASQWKTQLAQWRKRNHLEEEA